MLASMVPYSICRAYYEYILEVNNITSIHIRDHGSLKLLILIFSGRLPGNTIINNLKGVTYTETIMKFYECGQLVSIYPADIRP